MAFGPSTRTVVLTHLLVAPKLFLPPSKFIFSECAPMRILVAEDDAPLAEFLHQRLLQEQFTVQVASDGVEALRLAVEQAYDLVLLDLSRPEETSGLDVLRNIRAKKPDLPVLTIVRMGRGLMMGVDQNKNMTWVGSSAALVSG